MEKEQYCQNIPFCVYIEYNAAHLRTSLGVPGLILVTATRNTISAVNSFQNLPLAEDSCHAQG